jgi:hypothetical protein
VLPHYEVLFVVRSVAAVTYLAATYPPPAEAKTSIATSMNAQIGARDEGRASFAWPGINQSLCICAANVRLTIVCNARGLP